MLSNASSIFFMLSLMSIINSQVIYNELKLTYSMDGSFYDRTNEEQTLEGECSIDLKLSQKENPDAFYHVDTLKIKTTENGFEVSALNLNESIQLDTIDQTTNIKLTGKYQLDQPQNDQLNNTSDPQLFISNLILECEQRKTGKHNENIVRRTDLTYQALSGKLSLFEKQYLVSSAYDHIAIFQIDFLKINPNVTYKQPEFIILI